MLSNDLRALKIWFDQRLLDGCEMTAEGALAFSRELEAAIGKAETMETGGVPADLFDACSADRVRFALAALEDGDAGRAKRLLGAWLDDRLAARRRTPVEAGNVVRLFPL